MSSLHRKTQRNKRSLVTIDQVLGKSEQILLDVLNSDPARLPAPTIRVRMAERGKELTLGQVYQVMRQLKGRDLLPKRYLSRVKLVAVAS